MLRSYDIDGREASIRDRRAASRLAKTVEEVLPGEEAKLTFFGGVAVMTGRVRTLRMKRAIEGFLAGDPLVERVVSKFEVES